jgi:hypothetical protein
MMEIQMYPMHKFNDSQLTIQLLLLCVLNSMGYVTTQYGHSSVSDVIIEINTKTIENV